MELLLNMGTKINETMSDDLSRDFMGDEVFKALRQMHPTTALGLDGMPHFFPKTLAYCGSLHHQSHPVSPEFKIVLPSLISDFQIAFMLKRQITDNILMAYEVIHFLKRKNNDKQGYMSLKLDMSKAYDRVK